MYDGSNPAIIYVVKGEGKRLEMVDKLLREIAAAPERPSHAAAQAAVVALDPRRVPLAA